MRVRGLFKSLCSNTFCSYVLLLGWDLTEEVGDVLLTTGVPDMG